MWSGKPATTSTGLLRASFDALPLELAILDTSGSIVHTNQAWTGAPASKKAEAAGTDYLTACRQHGEEAGLAIAEGIEAVLDGDRDIFSFEYPRRSSSNGRWKSVQARAYTHQDEPHVIVIHRDVTERKRAEAQVQTHHERLEAVGSVLSHDLKNPLNVATGRVQLLAETIEHEHIAPLEAALSRVESMIEGALVLARHCHLEETEEVDLAEEAREAWTHVETDDASLAVSSMTLVADAGLLAHALENLFRNAVDHGGTEVNVRVGPLEAGQGFFVEDDGPGIPPSDRETIFETGYSTAEQGSGLGLPIVRQVVTAHGWGLTATESEGGGARFEITGVESRPTEEAPSPSG